jgi:hypothetical protein
MTDLDLTGALPELPGLTDQQLADLAAALAAYADTDEPATEEVVARLMTAADWADAIRAEQAGRADLGRRREDALARLRTPAVAAPEPEPEPAPDEPEQQAPADRQPVAAAALPAPTLADVAAHRPAQPAAPTPERRRLGLVAATDMGNVGRGTALDDGPALAAALTERLRTIHARPSASDGERFIVASASWADAYPPERRVSGQWDAARNDAVLAAVSAAATEPNALTAAGGLCGPVGIDWTIPVIGDADRPVRDALPSIGADHGGLRYLDPTVFTPAGLRAGVSIWTVANDANPGGANTGPGGTGTGPVTKPCIEIVCGGDLTVYVEAITSCVTLGNLRARFNPEQITAALSYLAIAQAQTAELELIRQMKAVAKYVTSAHLLGATRDLLTTLDVAIAAYRDRYRLSTLRPLRFIAPHWVRDMVRSDLAKAMHFGTYSTLAVTDAQIDDWFASRNVNTAFALDPLAADQAFAAQGGTSGTPAALSTWPATVKALLFAEGTFQLLDGGELDLGVVRDSQLNAQNKYQVFSEVFEAVAFRGFEAEYLTLTTIPNGGSVGTVAPA